MGVRVVGLLQRRQLPQPGVALHVHGRRGRGRGTTRHLDPGLPQHATIAAAWGWGSGGERVPQEQEGQGRPPTPTVQHSHRGQNGGAPDAELRGTDQIDPELNWNLDNRLVGARAPGEGGVPGWARSPSNARRGQPCPRDICQHYMFRQGVATDLALEQAQSRSHCQ